MKKAYLKNQLFYLIVAFIAFGYALFIYFQNSNYENFPSENHVITEINCNAAPKRVSSISIKKNNKSYSIELPDKECVNHFVGEKVTLKYNEQFDSYLISKKAGDSFRLTITGMAVLLLLLPWNYIKK